VQDGTSHTSPGIATRAPGAWILAAFVDRGSTTTNWAAAAGMTLRGSVRSGTVAGLGVYDSAGPVSEGGAAALKVWDGTGWLALTAGGGETVLASVTASGPSTSQASAWIGALRGRSAS
jgi:hypothetical protein